MAWREVVSSEPPVNQLVWEGVDDKAEEVKEQQDVGTSLCLSSEELLTKGGQDSRSIRKIDFEGCSYESGNHISVKPMNSDDMTTQFLKGFQKELVGYSHESEADAVKTGTGMPWWRRSFMCGSRGPELPVEEDNANDDAIFQRQRR